MRLHIYGHKQRLPQWARAALHPAIRDKLDGDLLGWRKTLQKDPCSYCGGTGGEADHIVARRNGGRDRWLNLAGTCERCNRAKGTRSLLAFAAGLHREMELNGAPLARFGGLTVATANLDEATGSGQPDRWGTRLVLEALLRTRPEAEGAVAYRRRHQGRGRRPAWIHALATPADGADAGAVCRRLGGGGSRTRGGVESDEPLFVRIDETRGAEDETSRTTQRGGSTKRPGAARNTVEEAREKLRPARAGMHRVKPPDGRGTGTPPRARARARE